MEGQDTNSGRLERRAFLAGAGTMGATAVTHPVAALEDKNTESAYQEFDHVIAVSDFHLGSPSANTDNFESFLEKRFLNDTEKNPDALILNGDGIEMWYRGMSSALLEFTNTIEMFEKIHEAGTEIVPIAGNHDWRLIDVNASEPVISPEPWQFQEEVFFESGAPLT